MLYQLQISRALIIYIMNDLLFKENLEALKELHYRLENGESLEQIEKEVVDILNSME